MSTVMSATVCERGISPIPMSRLVRLELRKLVDTRAGFWLITSMLVLSAGLIVALVATAGPDHLTFGNIYGVLTLPATVLLPILAILLVTSEWSQRTALITFSLEPRRGRIVLAKLATSVIMAALAVAVALAFAVIGTVLAATFRDGAGSWDMSGDVLRNASLLVFAGLLEGFGFAMLIRMSAPAIVAFFALPTVWTLLGAVIPWMHEHVAPWADLTVAQTPLQDGAAPFHSAGVVSASAWLHLSVALAIWVVLPLAVGAWRLLRAEIK